MSIIQATPEAEVGGLKSEVGPGKVSGIPYLKNKQKAKGAESMAQVGEHLPSRCGVLRANPLL
jgi:hypothetical protein